MAHRLTQDDFQARFDAHGRLTHLGHPDRIKDQPTCFHLTGPIREGHWYLNCGDRVYLRVTRKGIEVLNGKMVKTVDGHIDLASDALDLQEVVVALEDSTLPQITVDGKSIKVSVAGQA